MSDVTTPSTSQPTRRLWPRIVLVVLALLVLIPAGFIGWLSYTAAGLKFALEQLNRVPGMQVKVEGVRGRIAGPLHLDRFELDHERTHVVAEQLDMDLWPALLMSGTVSIRTLDIAALRVTLKPTTKPPTGKPTYFMPNFLRVSIGTARIAQARYVHSSGYTLDITGLRTGASVTHSRIHLDELDVTSLPYAARGELTIDGGATLQLAAALAADVKLADRPPLGGEVQMQGTTQALHFKVQLNTPHTASGEVDLSFPQGKWQLAGDISTPYWDLPQWLPSAPFTLRNTALRFTINDAGVHTTGTLVAPEWSDGALSVDAEGRYASRVLTLRRAQLKARNGRIDVDAHGRIEFDTERGAMLDLQAGWRGLRWPLDAEDSTSISDPAFFTSTRGTMSLRGRQPYTYEVDAQVTPRGWLPSELRANGRLSSKEVELNNFTTQTLDGSLSGRATLRFAQPREWRLEAQGRQLNPGKRFAAWPGQLNFRLQAQGAGFDANGRFTMRLAALNGRLRGQSVTAQGGLIHEPGLWQAQQFNATWGQSKLVANGAYGSRNDLQINFNSPTLQQLHPDLDGQLNMEGRMVGEGQQARLLLSAASNKVHYLDWELEQLQLNTLVDLSDRDDSHIELKVTRAARGDTSLENIAINGLGRASEHGIGIDARMNLPLLPPGLQARMQVHGLYDHERWYGTLDVLRIADAKNEQAAVLPGSVPFSIAATAAELQSTCLEINGGRGCVGFNWREGERWQVQASAQSFPIVIRNAALQTTTYLRAILDAKVDMHAEHDATWLGNAQAALSQAEVHYVSATGRDEVLPVKRGELHFDATAEQVRASGALDIGTSSTTSLQATVQRSGDMGDWPLQGSFNLSSSDARLIPIFVNDVDRADGQLVAQLTLGGTLSNPQFDGNISLKNGLLAFYQTNLILRDLSFDAQLATEQMQFTARGNAGEGVLNSNGRFTWQGQRMRGEFSLQGERLLVADLPEYRVLASPQLKFTLDDRAVNVSGEVLIPEARLQPKELTGAVTTSADARFKTDEVMSGNSGWSIYSDVNVKLGERVRFEGLGLQGNIGGAVRTLLRSGQPTAGRGELTVNDGQYEAYGRKLDIKRGRLIYDAAPLDDPGLDVQAEREIEDTTVGVNVRGKLRDPRLSFYSTPSMSQSEIISYLLVGKKLDDLQSGEAATVRSATNSLAMQGGGYLAGQLGRRIGIEQVGVETDNDNNSSLVLGKFLSPRLFVSYGISLSEAINTLKLRYTLTKRWSLKAEAGAAQSADVVFKVER